MAAKRDRKKKKEETGMKKELINKPKVYSVYIIVLPTCDTFSTICALHQVDTVQYTVQ